MTSKQNGPRSGTTTGFLLDPNRWYIVYLKKSKNFKKRLKEKKDAYKIMSMLRVHAYAGKCSHIVVTYFRIRD